MVLPETRPSLLARLQDAGDEAAWVQFVGLYGPVVFGFARKRGLQETDAADLTQEVFCVMATAAPRFAYDRRRGSFRSWLYTVARNELHDWLCRRERQCRGSGDSGVLALLEEQPAPENEQESWDLEYDRQLFAWAVKQVRVAFQDSSWQAFWQTAVEGRDPKVVAEELGMSLGALYIAKSRIRARLKKEICILQNLGECP